MSLVHFNQLLYFMSCMSIKLRQELWVSTSICKNNRKSMKRPLSKQLKFDFPTMLQRLFIYLFIFNLSFIYLLIINTKKLERNSYFFVTPI